MTVSDFIEALGGNAAAAALFGVTKPAVCNWKAWNRVPPRLHLRALREASARGLAFNPEAPAKLRKRS